MLGLWVSTEVVRYFCDAAEGSRVGFLWRAWLAFLFRTIGFPPFGNSRGDSADGFLGGSGLAFTVKTDGFRTIRNSSADSADGD